MIQQAMKAALAVLGLAALVVSAGCTPSDWEWMRRQTSHPTDYATTPLGRTYDTPEEISQLRDDRLRQWMGEWLDLREVYLDLWRERGRWDQEVIRVRNRMATYHALIGDRATQLSAMGQPLGKYEEYGASWQ